MLRIAICDDQPKELEIINEYITEYLGTHMLDAEMKEFSYVFIAASWYPAARDVYMDDLMAKEERS